MGWGWTCWDRVDKEKSWLAELAYTGGRDLKATLLEIWLRAPMSTMEDLLVLTSLNGFEGHVHMGIVEF